MSFLTIQGGYNPALFVLCRFASAVPFTFPADAKVKVGAMIKKLNRNDDEGMYPLVKLFRSLLASTSSRLPPTISRDALQEMTERMSRTVSLKVLTMKDV